MWVCFCRSVTDRQIADAVHDGARTLYEVGRTCGAGTGCGGCLPEVRRLVRAHRGPACLDCPMRDAAELVSCVDREEAVSIPA
jgi:bacterioferritin-associated ferredoxin